MNYREAGLRESEYNSLKETLGREPNDLELRIMGVMWSEHCSYKSTRNLLKLLPNKGEGVLMGPGENAGIINAGDGIGVAFKVESHNHPSAVAPYQGAATGVGGIIRDILALGARPVASFDGLFFGSKESHVVDGIIRGIGGYGNCIGVPTIGGKTVYDISYEGNPLVNALNLGLVHENEIVSSQTAKPDQLVMVLGSKTGRDGIAGAAFASVELSDDSKQNRPSIQIGDPFVGKLLIEACLEMSKAKLFVSMQDMGAAGILSSSSEVAAKSGVGMTLDFDKIPLRAEGMEPWEIALSESQERMLLIVEPQKVDQIQAIAHKWGLDAVVFGKTEEGNHYRIMWHGEEVANIPASTIGSDCPIIPWESHPPHDMEKRQTFEPIMLPHSVDMKAALEKILSDPNLSDKSQIFQQYDSMVQTNTIMGPGYDAGVFRIDENNKYVATSFEADPWSCYLDPFTGTANLVAKSCRVLAVLGATPKGMTNCLNFPSPEKPTQYWEMSKCVEGMAFACTELNCPVVSGNVSLYNETPSRGPILPTPVIGTVGIVDEPNQLLKSGNWKEGDAIFFVGDSRTTLQGSHFQRIFASKVSGKPLPFDAPSETDFNIKAKTTAHKNLANSGKVVSGGGLLVALAKEAMSSGIGAVLEIPTWTNQPEEIAFGERGACAIYSVPPQHQDSFIALWGDKLIKLGTVGGTSLSVQNYVYITLAELKKANGRA